MKKKLLILAAAVLAAALLLGGLPLLSRLVYHRSQAATLMAWQLHKDRYTTEEAFEERLALGRDRNSRAYLMPEGVSFASTLTRQDDPEMQVFVLNGEADGRTILYFPGGSYIDQPSDTHWAFLDRLAADTDSTVFVPIYPKLPEHDAEAAYTVLMNWLGVLIPRLDGSELIVMGDSAGGGMALSLALQLRDAGLRGPDRLILFSPWVDVTMSNPDIPAYQKKDPALDAEMLRRLGILWAGGCSASDPVVSPLYGDLSGLCEVTFFTTDGEILYPDLIALGEALSAAGTPYRMIEQPNLFHCWPLFAGLHIPESESAYAAVADIINGRAP